MKSKMKTLAISLRIFLFFTILTGIVYPLLITGIAQIVFNSKAEGSLVILHNEIRGSQLIGQQFDSSIYFSSRPSAVSYNPLPSGGSNYGLTNMRLKTLVDERKMKFRLLNHTNSATAIPSEMLFASGSGLDPQISPEAAFLQVDRVANARTFNTIQKQKLVECIKRLTEPPQLLCLGDKRVNVFMLNLETDKIK
jgi:potassium-transporting ATPase KdpC subunit